MRAALTDEDRLFGPAGILLALAAMTAAVRDHGSWPNPVMVVVSLGAAAVLLLAAFSAPRSPEPLASTSALLLSGLAALAVGAYWVLAVLPGDVPFSDPALTLVWMLVVGGVAGTGAWRTRSAAALLVAVLAASCAVIALQLVAFDTHDLTDARPALAFLALLDAAAAWAFCAPGSRWREVLVAAAGLTLVAIAYLSNALLFISYNGEGIDVGWDLVLLVGGLALALYAAHEQAPGAGGLAVVVLSAFVLAASEWGVVDSGADDSASGIDSPAWPIALLVLALLAAGAGLARARR